MLSGAEKYSPSGVSAEHLNHFSTIQTIDLISFSFLQASVFCGRQVGDYFLNQVASIKILVAVAPKVVAAWRVGPGVLQGIFSVLCYCPVYNNFSYLRQFL